MVSQFILFLCLRHFRRVHSDILYQLSSVQLLSLTLCSSVDCSTPGFPVYHQLLELAHTRVHRVGNTIQPSHPVILSSSCLQFGLFQCFLMIKIGDVDLGKGYLRDGVPLSYSIMGCVIPTCTSHIFLSFCFCFFFLDVGHFLSLYWICYDIASVLCFGFLATRHRILAHQSEIEPAPSVLEGSLSHWTAREVPFGYYFKDGDSKAVSCLKSHSQQMVEGGFEPEPFWTLCHFLGWRGRTGQWGR